MLFSLDVLTGNVDGPISYFHMNVHLFGAVSSPAVAKFSLHKTAETGRAEFGDEVAKLPSQKLYL